LSAAEQPIVLHSRECYNLHLLCSFHIMQYSRIKIQSSRFLNYRLGTVQTT